MIKEFYENIKGNYDEALNRMRDDERIKKYLNFFLMDESFKQLEAALNENNCQAAFIAAHNLKGVTQNMAFTDFANVIVEMTELLRAGNIGEASKFFPEASEKYNLIISEINKIM